MLSLIYKRSIPRKCLGLIRWQSGVHSGLLEEGFKNLNVKLQSRQVPQLVHLQQNELSQLCEQFETYIHQKVRKSQGPQEEVLDTTDTVSPVITYINPRIEMVSSILDSIHQKRLPPNILTYLECEDETALLSDILGKLMFKFYSMQKVSTLDKMNQTIDFSDPTKWYPEARMMNRKIVMHVGPTNSGKTFTSLEKLKRCRSGYYAGPLRLLAREVFENFNSKGITCNLVTGEEIIPVVDDNGDISSITSGTIEMVPLHKKLDLCIIDEIQMVEDDNRGEAWTSALLGVQAKEIHLCGEERTVELVKKIVELTGDELEVHRHERLGKLTVDTKPLKTVKNLVPGDCIVAFSKRKILQLKLQIESQTKYKVAVVYGALPPEIRSEQAKGFNNGTYDILVASDAVGMGLNLAIKRVVFSTVKKFNGVEVVPLTKSTVRQIGGRAGRFSHDKNKAGGIVTAMTAGDLRFIKQNMHAPIEDIEKANVWPTSEIWIQYISKFSDKKSVISILTEFGRTKVNSSMFKLSNIENRTDISELLMVDNLYRNLSTEDQIKLSIAPISFRNGTPVFKDTAFKFMKNIADAKSMSVLDFGFLPLKLLSMEPRHADEESIISKLTELEQSHKLVLTFMWLCQRWPYLFVDIESAYDWKSLIEKRITQELATLKQNKQRRK